MKKKHGLLIVLSGPSGVGKRTVWEPLINNPKLNLKFSTSMTTRKPRVGEKNKKDYFFVSSKKFTKTIKQNKLLEQATYAGNFYGTPLKFVNKLRKKGYNVFLEIEPIGGLNVIKLCKEKKDKDLLTIFVCPENLTQLKQQLLKRKTESSLTIEKRLAQAKWELNQKSKYQHILINAAGNAKAATAKLKQIILNRISL